MPIDGMAGTDSNECLAGSDRQVIADGKNSHDRLLNDDRTRVPRFIPVAR
jgi:hypothetical protein